MEITVVRFAVLDGNRNASKKDKRIPYPAQLIIKSEVKF